MNTVRGICGLCVLLLAASMAAVGESPVPPRIVTDGNGTQLIVDGKPMLLLGGELHNSTSSDTAALPEIFARLETAHLNTVLTPVYWELLEPSEGVFDFTHIDRAIDAAREHHLHIVFLWFGSWKNGMSSYVPVWVKSDAKRFPRVIAENGQPVEVLSTFSANNLNADRRAFVVLMKHLREKDEQQQTVLMVQVENEVGIIGSRRDRSSEADAAFRQQVPAQLIAALATDRSGHRVPSARVWNGRMAGTWSELFGDAADEWFTAWQYANYIQSVAEAGKREYALPMFVNAQLPALFERAGEYPGGGPHPANLAVWRVAAPALDLEVPDIYWPEFELWCQRYKDEGSPLFIPEARGGEIAALNAIYALGEAGALGFSPFAIDDLKDVTDPVAKSYAVLSALMPQLLQARAKGSVRALVLHDNSPRASRTLALGGYTFRTELARDWTTGALQEKDGALLVIETAPGDFLIAGSGLRVTISRDADAGPGVAGLASVDEIAVENGREKILRCLNGDENNQGRTLLLPAHEFAILRVKTYTVAQRNME